MAHLQYTGNVAACISPSILHCCALILDDAMSTFCLRLLPWEATSSPPCRFLACQELLAAQVSYSCCRSAGEV